MGTTPSHLDLPHPRAPLATDLNRGRTQIGTAMRTQKKRWTADGMNFRNTVTARRSDLWWAGKTTYRSDEFNNNRRIDATLIRFDRAFRSVLKGAS